MRKLILASLLSLTSIQAFAAKEVQITVVNYGGFVLKADFFSIPQGEHLGSTPHIQLQNSHHVQFFVDDSVTAIQINNQVLGGASCKVTLDLKQQFTQAGILVKGTSLVPVCDVQ